jgi:hypothetical protein
MNSKDGFDQELKLKHHRLINRYFDISKTIPENDPFRMKRLARLDRRINRVGRKLFAKGG